MKKFGFLLSMLTIAATSLLTSCFSSSGEMDEPNVPQIGGYNGTMVDVNSTTYVSAVSKVVGLSGYALVPKEAARELVHRGWGGILIILDEVDDNRKLSDPVKIKSHEFDVNTIKASCYPDGVSFGDSSAVDLTVTTAEAEGLDLTCELSGGSETLEPSINATGVHVKLPHFCDWMFKMKGKLEVVDVKTVYSDTIDAEVKKGDNVVRYAARYGYSSDVKNPFAVSYIRSLVGSSRSLNKSLNYFGVTSGTLRFCYKQTEVTVKVESGSRSFEFKVYGDASLGGYTFVSSDHVGGAGSNY